MCRPRSRPIAAIMRRRVRRRRAAVDAGVPDVAGGKTGQAGAPGSVGALPAGGTGWLAALRGSVPAVTSTPSRYPSPSVSARFGWVPRVCSGEVSQAVPVAVLARIGDPVAVGVLLARVEDRSELAPVPETVGVGILEVVPLAVAVRVLGMRAGTGRVLLLVRQSVVIGVLGPVRDAVTVGVALRRAGPRPVALVGVRQAIGIDCRSWLPRPRRPSRRTSRRRAP